MIRKTICYILITLMLTSCPLIGGCSSVKNTPNSSNSDVTQNMISSKTTTVPKNNPSPIKIERKPYHQDDPYVSTKDVSKYDRKYDYNIKYAGRHGRYVDVLNLLAFGADPNYCLYSREYLARENDVVELLLKKGADTTATDLVGNNVLMIYANFPTIIPMLLKYGADLNYKRPEDGMTPLMQAVAWANADTVECLLAAGANPNIALTYDDFDPKDIENNDDLINKMVRKGDTPLSYATKHNNTKIIELLKQYGAS